MQDTLTFPIRSDRLAWQVRIKERVVARRSAFQHIEVLDTEAFGRMLLLDGHVQLAEFDEFAYHEALVHIPALSLNRLKAALIVGGGDGGVLRELCKHESIEKIDMVEIDKDVIEISRQEMPWLSAGAFEDPRVNVHIGDAFPFVKSAEHHYDLIVVDSTDVYEDEEGELSEQLFTREFYADCRRALFEGGMVVTQADNLVFCPYSTDSVKALIGSVFPLVGTYLSIVPSFGGFSGYCWGSDGSVPLDQLPEAAEKLDLRYLTPSTFQLAMQEMPFKNES